MPEKHNPKRSDSCDHLAAYEMGLLENDLRVDFENHLSGCSECEEELFAMAPAMAELSANPGLYAGRIEESLRGQAPAESSWIKRLGDFLKSGPGRVVVPLAVAATLALLIFLPSADGTKYGSLATSPVPEYQTLQFRSAEATPWQTAFERGMQFYVLGDYSSAATDIGQVVDLLVQEPDANDRGLNTLDHARLYLGVSLMRSGDAAGALAVLTQVSESSILPIKQRGSWYLAQTYLLAEQPEAALEVLDHLKNSPVYGDKSAALSDEILEIMDR